MRAEPRHSSALQSGQALGSTLGGRDLPPCLSLLSRAEIPQLPAGWCGRILSFTTRYFSPARFSTTMSMKQATRPVRMPIMAQMTQRLISTVRKA